MRQVAFQIYNPKRGLYCGPRFWTEDAKGNKNPKEPDFLNCNFSELQRVGGGLGKEAAKNLLHSLRKRHPRTMLELHRVTTIIQKVRVK